MQYPFAMSFLALFIAVILIAQSSITIYNYNKNKQAHDTNYYWSCFVLVLGIVAAIGAMIGMFMYRGSAKSVVTGALGDGTGTPSVANLQAKANALQNLQKAQAEASKAFK
jgi:hypothetical protein